MSFKIGTWDAIEIVYPNILKSEEMRGLMVDEPKAYFL